MSDNPELSLTWISLSLINIITRFSVPAFVMISGAFILSNERNADTKVFFQKALIKIILPTALMILILFVIHICISGFDNIINVVKSIVKGPFYNLWYIYMLIGLYFLTPVIIKAKKTISKNQYRSIAFIMAIWSVVSQATTDENIAYSIGVVFAFMGYYLMGDVIKDSIDCGWKPNKIALTIVSTICIMASFAFRYTGHAYYNMKAYVAFFSPTIMVYSICTFAFFGSIKLNCEKIDRLAGITFEIYLVHTLVINALSPLFIHDDFNSLYKEFILVLSTIIVSTLLALAYKLLWKKVLTKEVAKKVARLKIWNLME